MPRAYLQPLRDFFLSKIIDYDRLRKENIELKAKVSELSTALAAKFSASEVSEEVSALLSELKEMSESGGDSNDSNPTPAKDELITIADESDIENTEAVNEAVGKTVGTEEETSDEAVEDALDMLLPDEEPAPAEAVEEDAESA